MENSLQKLEHFPTSSGVYLMKNKEGEVIYVGKAKNLKNRVKQYFLSDSDSRAMIPLLVEQTASIDTIVVPTEKEALLLENTLIKKHQPKFNAVLKDDKSFIGLMIDPKEPWPKLSLVRYTHSLQKEGLYFGPYTSALAAKTTYELLCRLFPLRQCSDEELKRRTRPCLLHAIKRCLAPCTHKCTKEEYDTMVHGATQFLKGKNKQVLQDLYAQMQIASDALDFEKAASLLSTIRQIEHVLASESLVAKIAGASTDVLGLYRHGSDALIAQLFFREGRLTGSESYHFDSALEDDEDLLSSALLQLYQSAPTRPQEILLPLDLAKAPLLQEVLSGTHLLFPKKGDKKALVEMAQDNARALLIKEKGAVLAKENLLFELQTRLKLSRYPQRIACLDTSHIAGSNPVAAIVLFTAGAYDKSGRRLFHIKSSKTSDDYGALKEVLTRYLKQAKEQEQFPDLLIVDGGKGQLSAALSILKEEEIIHIDLIALTKEKGRHDKGLTEERVFLPGHHDPIAINARSSLLFLLQNIRDSAHKQAIEFHRKQRSKRHISSQLDQFKGIGPIKKQRLLQHFGSFARIQAASPEELKAVRGITATDIHILKNLSGKSDSP